MFIEELCSYKGKKMYTFLYETVKTRIRFPLTLKTGFLDQDPGSRSWYQETDKDPDPNRKNPAQP